MMMDEQLAMKSYIAIGGILILAASACSMLPTRGEEFCQKTNRGGVLCIKKENINCEIADFGFSAADNQGKRAECIANGVYTDLTGKKHVWNTHEETHRFDPKFKVCYGRSYKGYLDIESGSLTCKAANAFFTPEDIFGKIGERQEIDLSNEPSPNDFSYLTCEQLHARSENQYIDPTNKNARYIIDFKERLWGTNVGGICRITLTLSPDAKGPNTYKVEGKSVFLYSKDKSSGKTTRRLLGTRWY